MVGIRIRVEQRDRDRTDALRGYGPDYCIDIVLVQGQEYLALEADPLPDLQPQSPLDQGPRLLVVEIVEARCAYPRQLQDVPESRCRDQGRRLALTLQDGIGGDGEAVAKLVDVLRAYAQLVYAPGKAVDDRAAVVVGCAGDLDHLDGAVVAKKHDIGEGASYVHAGPEASHGRCATSSS